MPCKTFTPTRTTRSGGRSPVGRRLAPALAVVAGLAVAMPTAWAWTVQDRQGNQPQRQADRGQERVFLFQSADDLLGTTVKNPQGQELATIDDLVVDRGTGRIHAVVIRESGFLGFGGTHVAVPYSAFTVDPSTASLMLNVSDELLEGGEDANLPAGWHRLEDDWEQKLDRLTDEDQALMQQLPQADQQAQTRTIQGTIAQVKRVDLGQTRHWLAVRIVPEGQNPAGNDRQGRDGGERPQRDGQRQNGDPQRQADRRADGDGQWVVLGPAWYAVGSVGTPVRGQSIEVEAFRGFGDALHARTASFNGQEVHYRDERFQPMWTNRAMRSERARSTPGPLVLISDVLDRDVFWYDRGRLEEVGTVKDAVVELTGGSVAVLAIEADGDWWGQAEGRRAVPFDVARIGKDRIVLDASRRMLGAAPVLPEDVRTLTMPRHREAVFVVFEVDEPLYLSFR
ncbi:MAG: hypothetical protein KatS3mg103_0539 [Phycisphaerales bacterium]|nr:MAG: hypothetical protein KatS3mg103_0539 [Phycisphaerales bacterium]